MNIKATTIGFGFLVAVSSINEVGCCIMTTGSFQVQVGGFTECLASLRPLFRHLVQISSSMITLDRIINLSSSPEKRK